MWVSENPNPRGKDVGDCAIRAISLATDTSWEDVYLRLCIEGALRSDLPNANDVWGSYLMQRGWYYHPIEHRFTYTIKDFCEDHPEGTYILGTGDHAVCIKDGQIHDTWDSSSKIPLYFFDMYK